MVAKKKKKKDATSEEAVMSKCRRRGGKIMEASSKHLMMSWKRQCEGACDLWALRSATTAGDGSRSSTDMLSPLCTHFKHVLSGTQLTAKRCLSPCWRLSPKLMWLDLVPLFSTFFFFFLPMLFAHQAILPTMIPLQCGHGKLLAAHSKARDLSPTREDQLYYYIMMPCLWQPIYHMTMISVNKGWGGTDCPPWVTEVRLHFS